MITGSKFCTSYNMIRLNTYCEERKNAFSITETERNKLNLTKHCHEINKLKIGKFIILALTLFLEYVIKNNRNSLAHFSDVTLKKV